MFAKLAFASLFLFNSSMQTTKQHQDNMPKIIKAILFDMDGTLLDTEALSDKAILLAFGSTLPSAILENPPMSDYRLPWELKKKILGLRGKDWIPIVKSYAVQHWQVSEASLPTM
jgi:hypothetical protein